MFILGLLLVINSAISAAYYLRIIRILLAPTSKNVENVNEAPLQLPIPIYIASAFIIIFGIWPDPIISIAQSTALQILSIGGG